MTRLLNVVGKLNESDRETVEEFAEFLLARRTAESTTHRSPAAEKKISFDGWAGCLAHIDKTAVELPHEASDLRVERAMKE